VSNVTPTLCSSTQPAALGVLNLGNGWGPSLHERDGAITKQGALMNSVYGRKRLSVGARETWMDGFTQLEPDGGFGAVVRRTWKPGASTLNGARPARVEMRPVYGHNSRRETWMDGFTQLEPEGGFRASVELAWGSSTRNSDERLAA
jgi:hypothetical protein